MIQPAGLGGIPAVGHRWTATVNASWTDSSAMSMSPNTRTRTATDRPYSARKTRSIAVASMAGTGPSVLGLLLERAHLDRRGAGLRGLGGPLQRRIEIPGLDHPEPAYVLLALGERAVGDQRVAVLDPDHGGRARRVEPPGEHPRPGRPQLVVERLHVPERLLYRLGRRERGALYGVHAEHVLLHQGSPSWPDRPPAGRPGWSRVPPATPAPRPRAPWPARGGRSAA